MKLEPIEAVRWLPLLGQNVVASGLSLLGQNLAGICGHCQMGKYTRQSHQKNAQIYSTQILELPHMDLMGSMTTERVNGKMYIFVCVDDFSRYTIVDLLEEK